MDLRCMVQKATAVSPALPSHVIWVSLEVRAPKPLGSLIPTIEVNKYKRPLVLTLVAQLTDT